MVLIDEIDKADIDFPNDLLWELDRMEFSIPEAPDLGKSAGKLRPIVIITHRLSFVARADAIIVLDQGRLVQVGPHDTLLGSCLPYKQLWNQQAKAYQ